MSKTIVLTAKHNLGVANAKRQLTERYENLKRTVKIDKIGDVQMNWVDDTANVSAKALGQKASARIDVAEHLITMTIQLPALLAPFGGAIVAFLEKNADALQP